MHWNDVSKHWTAMVPRVLTRWPDLEEDDVIATDGDRETFVRLVADQGNIRIRDAELDIEDWLQGAAPADAVMDESRDNERISASVRDIPAGEEPLDDDQAFGDDDKSDPPVGRS